VIRPTATMLSLQTASMATMRPFYTALLGPPSREVSGACFFALPGSDLVLWPGHTKGDGSLQLCLRVDDLAAVRAALTLEVSPVREASHGRECFLQDPDGNTVILYQPN